MIQEKKLSEEIILEIITIILYRKNNVNTDKSGKNPLAVYPISITMQYCKINCNERKRKSHGFIPSLSPSLSSPFSIVIFPCQIHSLSCHWEKWSFHTRRTMGWSVGSHGGSWNFMVLVSMAGRIYLRMGIREGSVRVTYG